MMQVEQKKYSNAIPLRISRESVYKKAEDLFNEYELQPGFDIWKLADEMGGTIKYVDMEGWFATQGGSIKVDGKENFTLYISNFTEPLRDRFTIAHELGHYILHSDWGKKQIKAARMGSEEAKINGNEVEWQANWFAAGFLMPTTLFKEAYEKVYIKNKNPRYLASIFLVSMPAADFRIKTYEKFEY